MDTWILIGGGNGSSNMGDEAMWEAAARSFRKVLPEATILTDAVDGWVSPLPMAESLPYISQALRRGGFLPPSVGRNAIGGTVERVISRPGRDSFARRAARRELVGTRHKVALSWRDAIESSAGLVFCGCGGINDHYASHAITGWGLLAEWAYRAGKPIAFIGQGIGPLVRRENIVAAERMLSLADLITVRDPESLAVVRSMGAVGGRVELTPDWACLLTPTREERAAAQQFHEDVLQSHRFVAVSLHRRPASTRRDLLELSELLRSIARGAHYGGLRVLVVPTMRGHLGADDIATAKSLMKGWAWRERGNVSVLDHRVSVGFTRAILARSNGMVATRYHALIFGLGEGVPSIGVSHDDYYNQKLRGALAMMGGSGDVISVRGASDRIESFFKGFRDPGEFRTVDNPTVEAIAKPFKEFLLSHAERRAVDDEY